MRVVEVLGDVREWFDQNGDTAVRLNVERTGAVGIVRAQIESDDLAERFRKAFRGASRANPLACLAVSSPRHLCLSRLR